MQQPDPVDNRRITEWLGLEGTSRIMKLQGPCLRQGHQPPYLILDQAAQAPSNLALNTSRDGRDIHSLSGQLFQRLTTLIGKNFPLTSNLNLPSFNLKSFPYVIENSITIGYSNNNNNNNDNKKDFFAMLNFSALIFIATCRATSPSTNFVYVSFPQTPTLATY